MSAYVPYPSLEDPNFNGTLARKKEFNLQNTQSAATPTGFALTPSQKRVRNFLSPSTPYNGILLFHATGTGKTCSAITIAEQFSDTFTKKHFVLLPSSTLKDNFKQQIFDAAKIQVRNGALDLEDIPSCTGDRYVRAIPNNKTLDRDALSDKVKKIVNDRWQFRGYLEFANEYDRQREAIAKTEPNPERAQRRFERYLKNTYSNRVFVMDEAHNLRTAAESTKKLVPPKVEHVLRVAENVKLILLSATPMFDSATEIVYLINLLRLNDKLPPIAIEDIFSPRKGLTNKGRQNLIAATRGYVSFLPVDNPKAFPMRLYPSVNKDPKVMRTRDFPATDFFGKDFTHEFNPKHIVVSRFGEYQRKAYEALRPKRATKKMQDAADAKVQVLMQVSNVAFPAVEDGEAFHGDKLFDKCFQSKSTGRIYDPAVLKKHEQFLAPDHIANYAAKIKTIVDYVLSSEGVIYIYSSFVYSGILPLAIALEHVGYRKYGGNNILADAGATSKKRAGAYVILSANKEFSPNNDAEIAASKSPQNANGELIKVIIASNVASEGVDFKYIREVHIMEPWYNYNKMEQIIGRAIRQYSHEALPPEKRNVTIYQHANALPDRETIDLYAYRLAETKDALMSQVEEVLKSNAIDCLLATPSKQSSKEKVVTSQGIETSLGSTSSNQPAKQTCLGATKATQPDASTFSKAFLTTEIYELKKHIKRAFQKHHAFTFEALVEVVRPTDNDAFMYALDEVVKDRERVLNKDNVPGYVLYRSNKYLFQPTAAKDTRLLIEDRAAEVLQTQNFGRNKINLRQLRPTNSHTNSQAQPPQSRILKQPSQAHTPQTQQPSLLSQIEEAAQKVLKFVTSQEAPDFEQAAHDYVIDRLTPKEHMALLQRFESLPGAIQTSLSTCSGVYFDANAPKYYTDVSTEYKDGNPYYTLSDGTFKRASRLELPKIADLAYEKQVLLKERMKTLRDISAFVTPQVIKHKLKIVRENAKKTTGSVCASTSDFSVETMKSLIEKVGRVALPPKTTKVSLCEIYELALRRFAPQKFLRPHAYALLLAKK